MAAVKNVSKIISPLVNPNAQFNSSTWNQQTRNIGSRKKERPKIAKDKCPDITCNVKPPKKRSLFSRLFKKKPTVPKCIPPIECCKLKQAECKPEPDLSEFGGKAFKTCGSAFVIQKKVKCPAQPFVTDPEDKVLKLIEGNLGTTKENFAEKMPSFTTVEQRLLDLHDRRLHPMYKNFENIPQDGKLALPERERYKTRSGPAAPHEIPVKLQFNRELLESKNRFADYKRVEPPRQLVGRMLEVQMNKRPSIRKKKVPVLPPDAQARDRKAVFDTLYQKEIKF